MKNVKMVLTGSGGYIVGDGDFEGDPDTFYLMLCNKMQEAVIRHQKEVTFTEDEIQRYMDKMKERNRVQLEAADRQTYEEVDADTLLNVVLETTGRLVEAQAQEQRQLETTGGDDDWN